MTAPLSTLAQPAALALVLLVALLWWRGRGRGPLTLALRSAVLLALALWIAGARMGAAARDAATSVLLIDVSRSVPPAVHAWLASRLTTLEPPPGQCWIFARTIEAVPCSAEALDRRLGDTRRVDPGATDVAGALAHVVAAASGRPIYLVSDGWETRGETQASLGTLTASGGVFPLLWPPEILPPNVAVSLSLPERGTRTSEVEARVVLTSSFRGPVPGTLEVRRDGTLVRSESLALAPGTRALDLAVRLEGEGPANVLTAAWRATPADLYPGDDRATAWVGLGGEARVLLVAGGARATRYLPALLEGQGHTVTTVRLDRQRALPPPGGFAAVVLSGVRHDALPAGYAAALERYVHDGGALLMAAGAEALAGGGFSGSPVERALPITFSPPARRERRAAVVLVIDKSGSMRRERKLLYAKVATKRVLGHLGPRDLFGVIGFDRAPFPVVPLQRIGGRTDEIATRIDRLRADGGTYLLPALEAAKREIERQPAARKHVIVLTDGETGGGTGSHLELVTAMRELGITVSTVAVGDEPNLRLLSRVADIGGGAFHHTTDPASLPEIFLGEVEEIGKDTRIVERALTPRVARDTALVPAFAGRRLPALAGAIDTRPKPGARVDVDAARDDRPLLASWAYGNGRAVAFASDLAGRWSAAWVAWPELGRFWSEALAWLAPAKRGAEVSLRAGYDAGALHVAVTSYDAHATLDRHVLMVRDPARRAHRLALTRHAPGRYGAVLPTRRAGDYTIALVDPAAADAVTAGTGFTLAPALVEETPRIAPNLGLLSALAAASGGALRAAHDPTPVAARGRATSPSERPAAAGASSPWLIAAVMLLTVLEVTARRLGW